MASHLYTLTGRQTVDASGDPIADTDTFSISGKKNLAIGHDGTDYFYVSDKLNSVQGGLGDDHVTHTFGYGGVFDGGEGNDSLFGLAGDEFIGGDGLDTAVVDLSSHKTALRLDLTGFSSQGAFNLPDDTRVKGVESLGVGLGAGADTVLGGADDAILINGGKGDDSLVGGDANDNLYGGAGADTVLGGGGGDYLFAFASYIYTIAPGEDDAHGGDKLSGGDGPDVLFSSHGRDTLDGGADRDQADFSFSEGDGVRIALKNGAGIAFGDGRDTLVGIEDLIGSKAGDMLTGDAGGNYLYGYDGADTLEGGKGADTLSGGAGDGAVDVFVYADVSDSPTSAPDYLVGFEVGVDRIDLHLIDANGKAGAGNGTFSFGAHLKHPGDAILQFDGFSSHIYGDTNGDGTADLSITVSGQISVADIIA